MSTRGQVIIPKAIRDATKSDKNTAFVVAALTEDTIILKKLDYTRFSEEFRKLRAKASKLPQQTIDDEIAAARRNRHERIRIRAPKH
jgi:bifunctional DNA-binding transcriptional regulator/antitoxin component of YhaV-PrlF toxin-antitoxin module